ncbi:hypothetical protein V2J09_016759 [Rumex salicifolius]
MNSFCLNPNPTGIAPEDGPLGGSDGFFWESQIWPFANTSGNCDAEVKKNGKVVEEEEEEDMVTTRVKMENAERKEGKGKRKADVDVETHIYTERERRKKMRNMFSSLHAMLPQLPPKTDKTTIVDEAVRQIKTLEIQLEKLQEEKENKRRCSTNASITFEPSSSSKEANLKQARQTTRESFLADHGAGQPKTVSINTATGPIMFHTWTSPNVVLNTFGHEAQITICAPRKLGLLTDIVLAFEKNMIEVESANASSYGRGNFYMFHVRLANGATEHSPLSFSADGVFKEAIREMMPLFPSN